MVVTVVMVGTDVMVGTVCHSVYSNRYSHYSRYRVVQRLVVMDNFDEMVSEAESLRTVLPVTNGQLALDIAQRAGGGRGWRVFPCHETHAVINGKDWIKSPYADTCPHGFKDATKAAEIIRDWWKRHPDALVGIALGRDMLALDLDRNHKDGADGVAEFYRLNKLHGGKPVPCGVAQNTMSGGKHLFFALPELPAGYIMPKQLSKGIDLKGFDTGYVCTGKLSDGTGYSWTSWYQNYLTGLCYPPLWVVQIIAQFNAPKLELSTKREYSEKPDMNRVRDALHKIDAIHADNYALWINIGMALHGLGADGLYLWHEFSKQNAKYDSKVLGKKWNSFKKDISIGYIFNLAKGK